MLSHRNLMAMTVSHLADFDDPDADRSLVHGARCRTVRDVRDAVRAARGASGDPPFGRLDKQEFLDRGHHPGARLSWCTHHGPAAGVERRPCPGNLRTVITAAG